MHPNKKIKICYIISDIYSSDNLENTIVDLSLNFKINIVLINKISKDSKFKTTLSKHNIPFVEFVYSNKFDLLKITFKLWFHIKKYKYDIIHCHLFEATILGLIAGKIAGVKKRIYTRHHSTYHHIYFPKAVKYDLLSNNLATHIISISAATFETLTKMEKAPPQKIFTIYHPFKINQIQNIAIESKEYLYKKWNIPKNKFIFLCISRYIEWKGIQYIIPAFEKFLQTYPDSFLILANAYGPYKNEIKKLLENLPPNSYLEIPFEENVYGLYKISDVFIHTPIDDLCEAFGQVYIESFISGVPSIITKSGIAIEIAKHKFNSYIVPFKNSESIYLAMIEMIQNPELRNTIINNAYNSINQFNFDVVMSHLIKLYNE